MRTRLAIAYGATAVVVLLAAVLGATFRFLSDGSEQADGSKPDASPESQALIAAQPAPPAAFNSASQVMHPNQVTITSSGFWSWALLDRETATVVGSSNKATAQKTASMIKAWLAADYLRLAAAKGQKPSSAALNQLSIMIRDSDNNAASATYVTLGKNATIKRLISICGLTDTKAGLDWAKTMMSARDAVRMGLCIADGRGAGPTWTTWVLSEMRAVRGVGRFGPIEVLPAAEAKQTAIKNGWVALSSDGKWHVNCLAIGPAWVLAVETVYPASVGMSHGTTICRNVTKQLLAKPA
ncbi:MAG: hypothetical protein JXA67_13535 [Micromonosporaceae bacterium]|nr:hypothetical protein [Micromonosporaceae bacterium]